VPIFRLCLPSTLEKLSINWVTEVVKRAFRSPRTQLL